MKTDKFFIVSLDYGDKKVTDIYEFGKFIPPVGSESTGTLLHPTLKVYTYNEKFLYDNPDKHNSAHPLLIDEIHFNENLLANVNIKEEVQRLKNIQNKLHNKFLSEFLLKFD